MTTAAKAPARKRRRIIRPRLVYGALTLGGSGLVVLGIGLIFPPAALVLAGLAAGGLGLLGIGLEVRS